MFSGGQNRFGSKGQITLDFPNLFAMFVVMSFGLFVFLMALAMILYKITPQKFYVWAPGQIQLKSMCPYLNGKNVGIVVADTMQPVKYKNLKNTDFQFEKLRQSLFLALRNTLLGANVTLMTEADMQNVSDDTIVVKVSVNVYCVSLKGGWNGFFHANIMMAQCGKTICERVVQKTAKLGTNWHGNSDAQATLTNAYAQGADEIADIIAKGATLVAMNDKTV